MNSGEIERLITNSGRRVPPNMKIVEDTTEFMELDQGDVMILQEAPYLISRNEKEVGFGQDDEPKYWVKRAINLLSGETTIVKLVFFEEFAQKIGSETVTFYRSPLKEARVLDLVQGQQHFMQGSWVNDAVGNNVRIIDFIWGPSLNKLVTGFDLTHEQYFYTKLPEILKGLGDCLQSLSYLHENNLVHGDVRWDHVLFDRELKIYRWIDFDYNYDFPENPFGVDLFGIGKILAHVIGKGGYFYADIKSNPKFSKSVDKLVIEDFSLLEQNRLVNLQKIYPYIPDRLNDVLLHFSGHSSVFYESVDQLMDEFKDALGDLEAKVRYN